MTPRNIVAHKYTQTWLYDAQFYISRRFYIPQIVLSTIALKCDSWPHYIICG